MNIRKGEKILKELEMKYEANWSVNNGSSYGFGYYSNNKRELAKLIRSIAKGNTPRGDSGRWAVTLAADNSEVVLQGRV